MCLRVPLSSVPGDDLEQQEPARYAAGGARVAEGQGLEKSPVFGLWDHSWKSSSRCSTPGKTGSLQMDNFSCVESFHVIIQ